MRVVCRSSWEEDPPGRALPGGSGDGGRGESRQVICTREVWQDVIR